MEHEGTAWRADARSSLPVAWRGAGWMTQQPAPGVVLHQALPGHEAVGTVLDGPIGELVAELLAAWNAHDVDRVMGCYNPAFEGIDVGEAAIGQGITNV